MKSLELTQEHKDKLLEMCKILFPEYEFTESYTTHKYPEDLFLKFGRPESTRWENEIHWFEFCMTHLPVELHRYAMHQYNVEPREALKIITNNLLRFEDFGRYDIHPVDYLYEQFKKLN